MTILLILITFSLHNILLLLGEKQCWSLSGLKGLTWEDRYCLQPQLGMGAGLTGESLFTFLAILPHAFHSGQAMKMMPLNIEKAEQFQFISAKVSGKFLVWNGKECV